jgi:guanylate kinase
MSATKPLIIVGPSAVGKGTLTDMLFVRHPAVFGKKISTTTRAPRAGEIDGKHYHFVTMEQFMADEAKNLFIETADVHGKKYGTSYAAITAASESNRVPLLELDVQGVCTLKQIAMDTVNSVLSNCELTEASFDGSPVVPVLNATCIWINPPSQETLLDRLRGRGTETEEQIMARLITAKFELAFFQKYQKIFDKVIINDDLDRSYQELEEYLINTYPEQFSAKRE